MLKIGGLFLLLLALLLPASVQGQAADDLIVDIVFPDAGAVITAGVPLRAIWTISGGTAPYSVEGTWDFSSWESDYQESVAATVTGSSSTIIPAAEYLGGDRHGLVNLSLTVRDNAGNTARGFSELVNLQVSDLDVKIELNRTKVDLAKDETITASWEVSGQGGPFTFQGYWHTITDEIGNTQDVVINDLSGNSTTWRPTVGLKASFVLVIFDGGGKQQAFSSPYFQILGGISSVGIEFSPDSARAGEPVKATAAVSGGIAPYSYRWRWYIHSGGEGDGPFYGVDSGSASTFTPAFGEEGSVWLEVTDGRGAVKEAWAYFTITDAPPVAPLEVAFSYPVQNMVYGQRFVVNWEISGGAPPYENQATWEYTYHDGDADYTCTGKVVPFTGTAAFAPSREMKSVHLLLFVRDHQGRVRTFYAKEFPVQIPEETTGIEAEVFVQAEDILSTDEFFRAGWNIAGGQPPYLITPAIIETLTDGGNGYSHFESPFSSDGPFYQNWLDLPLFDGIAGGRVELTVEDAEGRVFTFHSAPFTVVQVTDPKPSGIRGDANSDQKVDILDLVAIIDYIVSETPCTDMTNANANGSTDGKVDILDLVWVIDRIVGG